MAMTQIRVLGGAMARVPADATAFAHRDATVMVAIITPFEDPAERPIHGPGRRPTSRRCGPGSIGVYSNFLEAEGEGRIREAYPGATYARLAEVKRQYDPTQPVPPQPEHPSRGHLVRGRPRDDHDHAMTPALWGAPASPCVALFELPERRERTPDRPRARPRPGPWLLRSYDRHWTVRRHPAATVHRERPRSSRCDTAVLGVLTSQQHRVAQPRLTCSSHAHRSCGERLTCVRARDRRVRLEAVGGDGAIRASGALTAARPRLRDRYRRV